MSFFDCVDDLNSSPIPENYNSSSKLSGINLKPTDFEFQYSNDADFQNYGLLSSYTCCDTVNRPESLWIVDGMLGKEQQIGVTLQNIGSTSSGQFDLRVYVEHNEYDEFIIFDQTIQVSSISGSSSKMVYLNWIPDYSGNHTIYAITLHPQDDDSSNDQYSRHYTVGFLYENANAVGIWNSMSSHWSIDSDTGITPHSSSTFYRNSFYVGDQNTVSYGNNWNEVMDSSVIDFGDRVSNPTKSFQISFLASGASKSGDNLYLKIQNSPNNWKTLGTLNAVIDSSAANWNLFNYNINPIDMNSNSKLRLSFTSNAVNTDSGYWIDDFVMVYDQAARDNEFNPVIVSISDGESAAEEWSEHDLEVKNIGNLEDKFNFEITNLPIGWDWTLNYKNGGPIDSQTGIEVPKGTSKNITVRVKPSSNSSLGDTDLNFKISSVNSISSSDTEQFKITVLPTYLPILEYDEEISLCRPGNTCELYATLTNGGDVYDSFDISSSSLLLRPGWLFDLSWNQQLSVPLDSGESTPIRMTVSVPSDTIPGQYSSLFLSATSDAREDIIATLRVNASASMISDASFSVNSGNLEKNVINPIPGSIINLPFTLWNNASVFDTFEVCFERTGSRSWIIESNHEGMLIDDGNECLNPYSFEVSGYSSIDVYLTINIPENAQSGDSGPLLTPIIRSTRSNDTINSVPFDGISVSMVSDLEITDLNSNNYLSPGSENILTFNISNKGNGADEVEFILDNLDYEWNYWFSNEGTIIDNYSLSPGYEGNDIATITLHLFVPDDVMGEISINFQISISSSLYNTEIDYSNNIIYYSGLTAMNFQPEWVISPINYVASEADTVVELNATLINSGNSFDDNLKVKFDLEKMNQYSGLSIVLSVPTFGDEYFSSGQWASIPLDKDQLARVEILIIIPSGINIPSELNIIWTVQGGSNQLGESLTLTNYSIVDVSIYRSISAELGMNSGIYAPSSIEYFSINFSSYSSIIEEMNITYEIPEGWFLFCKDPSNDGEFKVVIPAAISGNSRKSRIDCSLQIGEDSGLKEIKINLVDADGYNIQSWNLELAIQSEVKNSFLSSFFEENALLKGLMFTFGGIILVLLSILLIQRNSDKYEYEEDLNENSVYSQASFIQQNQQSMIQNTVYNSQMPQTVAPIQNTQPVSNFSQPQSRPPSEIESQTLEDAFGSLMSGDN